MWGVCSGVVLYGVRCAIQLSLSVSLLVFSMPELHQCPENNTCISIINMHHDSITGLNGCLTVICVTQLAVQHLHLHI